MTASADSTFKTSVVANPLYTSGGGSWVSNPTDAQWISPREDCSQSVAVGFYNYFMRFDLTGLNPASVSISLNVAVDNNLTLKLNGVTVFTLTGGAFSNFESLHAVTIASGFVAGFNTLEAIVENTSGVGANPSGLLVEITAATGTHT
jgi:hypothetical protein